MSILFQVRELPDWDWVALNPYSGNLNGSNCNLWFSESYGGSYSFTALEDCQVNLTSSLDAIRVNGIVANSTQSLIPIVDGETYTFEWGFETGLLLPFSLIMGLAGVGMVFGGSIGTIHFVREHEWKTVVTTLIIALVGYALVVGWFY
jgi:hypothetical protein